LGTTVTQLPCNRDLERNLRARAEGLSYLPTTVAVAMKLIDLGKNAEADPAEYAQVVGVDGALSAKLLALANSSWFGVRNRVTKISLAINLLGLTTVRTMSISYCLAGLHNELGLTPDETRMFWESSLARAIAARRFAEAFHDKATDEAFAAGLFADFAMPIMFATARAAVLAYLGDYRGGWEAQLARERALFRVDHAELGRIVAQKLALPDLYLDAIGLHHNYAGLRDFLGNPVLANALHTAALLPHNLGGWNASDARVLGQFLSQQNNPALASAASFIDGVQKEFATLRAYFDEGEAPEPVLPKLLQAAACESAQNTERLVGTVQDLLSQAAQMGERTRDLMSQRERLETLASHDGLTGVLTRSAFEGLAHDALAQAAHSASPIALAYLDVDNFKTLNDSHGHAYGDAALKRVVAAIQATVRGHDLIGRLGGDEFGLLLPNCVASDAQDVIKRVIQRIGATEDNPSSGLRLSVSVGLVCIPALISPPPVENLFSIADRLMYAAKKAGGNRGHARVL
jgi:diguanylate cyclase (GGDEF)-like protein